MTDLRTVQLVVRFLGVAAIILAAGLLLLTWSLIHQDHIDPSAVAVCGSIGTLAGTTIGALGSLLVSTRSGPTPDDPPIPVTVADEPVMVDQVAPAS